MAIPALGDSPDTLDYALLDASAGRRVERFGRYVVDRPSPAAPDGLLGTDLPRADLVFERTRDDPGDGGGRWVRGADVEPWRIRAHGLRLELRAAAGGQVGLFPEHARLWPWIADGVAAAAARLERPPAVLSLFAYTGGASLVAGRAGGAVAHVDASRPAVAWARVNADASGLGAAPIRWLVDDALTFVERERRRGRTYDVAVIDPPSYGHGGTGRAWRIATDLPALLAAVAAVMPDPALVLLTAHTPGWDGDRLAALVGDAFGLDAEPGALAIEAASGRILSLGASARWTA